MHQTTVQKYKKHTGRTGVKNRELNSNWSITLSIMVRTMRRQINKESEAVKNAMNIWTIC